MAPRLRSLASAAPAAARVRPDTGSDSASPFMSPPDISMGLIDGPGVRPGAVGSVTSTLAPRRSLAATAQTTQMPGPAYGTDAMPPMPGAPGAPLPFPGTRSPIDGSPSVGVPYLGPHTDGPGSPVFGGGPRSTGGGGWSGDGPGGGSGGPSDAPSGSSPVEWVTKAVSRMRVLEGPRGYSTRVSVILRYVCYFFTIIICSVLSNIAFQTTAVWRSAGEVMFFSANLMLLASALSTVFYANYRSDIIRQARHFIFGIAVIPGAGIAAFQWAVTRFLNNPATDTDSFAQVLHSAVPILFFVTVCIPALILIKYVAGIRTMHRTNLDDQEMLSIITRQDGLQR